MAFTHYRTKGVFLKMEDRGEADQVFTLFTEKFGKIKVLGRGIRKITAKLRPATGGFYFRTEREENKSKLLFSRASEKTYSGRVYLSEIEFIQGKQYKTLTDAVLINKFDVDYKVAEAIDGLTAREQRDDKIWTLLTQTLKSFLRSDPSKLSELSVGVNSDYFLWNLFDILGYAPQLHNCACCENKLLQETFFFVPQDGGVVCWQCFSKKDLPDGEWYEIPVSIVKILRFLLKEPLDVAERLKIQRAEQEHLQNVSEVYLNSLKQINNPRNI